PGPGRRQVARLRAHRQRHPRPADSPHLARPRSGLRHRRQEPRRPRADDSGLAQSCPDGMKPMRRPGHLVIRWQPSQGETPMKRMLLSAVLAAVAVPAVALACDEDGAHNAARAPLKQVTVPQVAKLTTDKKASI